MVMTERQKSKRWGLAEGRDTFQTWISGGLLLHQMSTNVLVREVQADTLTDLEVCKYTKCLRG